MSRIDKALAVYTIFMGILMITWWSLLLATNQMPELQTAPIQAKLHLTAEFLTALTLLMSGVGLLRNSWWAKSASYVSLGMLLYAVVQASGHSAQTGQPALVAMFAVSTMIILVFLTARARFDKALA
jgi:peptidoglycan/LPS O-acetylase OafA/YrhL